MRSANIRLIAFTCLMPLGIARADTAAPPAAATPSPAQPVGVITLHPDQRSVHPTITADAKGNLHVVYEAYGQGRDVPDIFYTFSTDGRTWTDGINLSKTPGISNDPTIAVHGDGVIVAWIDTTSGDDRPDVFVSRSADLGKTWSQAVNVSNTTGKSSQPSIAIAPDGTIHIVWIDTTEGVTRPDVWYAAAAKGGDKWSKARNISTTPGVSSEPSVACGPKGEVYVSWDDTSKGDVNRDVWFAGSANGGKKWSKPIDISNTPGLSANPAIATDTTGTIYVAWDDTTTGDSHPDIFVTISHDGGKKFEKYIDVSPTPGISSNPGIHATGDGNVAVVWTDTTKKTEAPDVWIAHTVDGGKTWTPQVDLSNTPGVSGNAHPVIVNGTAFVIWEEDEHGKAVLKLTTRPIK